MPLLHPALLDRTVPSSRPLPPALLDDRVQTVPVSALAALTRWFADTPALWRPLVRHRADDRWYTRLALSGTVEVWLIGWNSGQRTAVHDHGGALGALALAAGTLIETVHDRDWVPRERRVHTAGATLAFGPDHVHQVTGGADGPATSIHAYSPPQLPMRYAPGPDRELVGALS